MDPILQAKDFDIPDPQSGPSSLSSDDSLVVIDADAFSELEKELCEVPKKAQKVIVFHSVEEEYVSGSAISCQYICPKDWTTSPDDCVVLIKVGWVSVGECAIQVPCTSVDAVTNIGVVVFPGGELPKNTSDLYQFCYMRNNILLGASTPFQFKQVQISLNKREGDVVEQLAEQLKQRDMKLGLLQEECTKLTYRNEELSKTHAYALEGVQAQLRRQQEVIFQIAQKNKSMAEDQVQTSEENLRGNAPVSFDFCEDESPVILNLKRQLQDMTEEKQLFQEQLKAVTMLLKDHKDELSSERTRNSDIRNLLDNATLKIQMLQNEVKTEQDEHVKTFQHFHTLEDKFKKAVSELDSAQQKLGQKCMEVNLAHGELSELKVSLQLVGERNGSLTQEVHALKEQVKHLEVMKKSLEEELEKQRNKYSSLARELEVYRKSQLKLTEENIRLSKELEEKKLLLQEKQTSTPVKHHPPENEVCSGLINQLGGLHIMTLETQLEEETRLSLERDQRLVEVEERLLNSMRYSHARTASAASRTDNDLMKEMEDNTACALVALESALKESATLRKHKEDSRNNLMSLRAQLTTLEKEWKEQIDNCYKACHTELTTKLRKAAEEYRKLYVDKVRVEDKFEKLKHKVRKAFPNSEMAEVKDLVSTEPSTSSESSNDLLREIETRLESHPLSYVMGQVM